MSLASSVAVKPQRGARVAHKLGRSPRGVHCRAETKTVEWSVLDDALAYVKSTPTTEVRFGGVSRWHTDGGPVLCATSLPQREQGRANVQRLSHACIYTGTCCAQGFQVLPSFAPSSGRLRPLHVMRCFSMQTRFTPRSDRTQRRCRGRRRRQRCSARCSS